MLSTPPPTIPPLIATPHPHAGPSHHREKPRVGRHRMYQPPQDCLPGRSCLASPFRFGPAHTGHPAPLRRRLPLPDTLISPHPFPTRQIPTVFWGGTSLPFRQKKWARGTPLGIFLSRIRHGSVHVLIPGYSGAVRFFAYFLYPADPHPFAPMTLPLQRVHTFILHRPRPHHRHLMRRGARDHPSRAR